MSRTVLAFDTATETLAIGLGSRKGDEIEVLRTLGEDSPRKANSVLLPRVVAEMEAAGRTVNDIAEVVVGCGPGSFTGVRIGVATAKGVAAGLEAPLYGISTLDAVAWHALLVARPPDGSLIGVLGDAMRGEVYPALFRVRGGRVERLGVDRVAHPARVAEAWDRDVPGELLLAGNGLRKYSESFRDALGVRGVFLPESAWVPDGASLLAAYADARLRGDVGPGEPALVLPIYTRLSDAEEAERVREGAVRTDESDSGRAEGARPTLSWDLGGPSPLRLRAMVADDIERILPIELASFPDAWSPGVFADELVAPRRAWIVAEQADEIMGFGGIAALGDEAHVMNLAVRPDHRGEGIGRKLLERLMQCAIELGPELLTLEVRESNRAAIGLYESVGMTLLGRRSALLR